MITDEQVRAIALFFLFALMDEKIALRAAEKAVASLKATHGRAPGSENAAKVEDHSLIRAVKKSFDQHVKLAPRNRAVSVPDSMWKLPSGFDAKTGIQAWTRFQQDSGENEIVAVIFSRVLGFRDEDIADGLNVSLGTARYRIGKGMRQLGIHVRAARV